MYVRLAFAVAAFLEPEILIVDEVLAVGDAEFQKKAIGKMQDVSKGEGRTVLFVSHNMSSIEALCNSLIIIHNGAIEYNGEVGKGISEYLTDKEILQNTIKDGITFSHPDFSIDKILINNSPNPVVNIDRNKNELIIFISGKLKHRKKIALEARLFDNRGNLLAFFSPGHLYSDIKKFDEGYFQIEETVKLPMNLSKGEFMLSLLLANPNVEPYLGIHGIIRVNTQGILTSTGFELNYKDRGFIILTR
jgi:lipopolysaccharide transport system ATP-binding protein